MSFVNDFLLFDFKLESTRTTIHWIYLTIEKLIMSEFQLDSTPSDGVSSVKFAPKSSQYLAATSWDKTVR
jgi:hypothetical protein